MASFNLANLQGWVEVVIEDRVKFTKDDFDFTSSTDDEKRIIVNLYNLNFSRRLSYWISIFMRGRDSKTNKRVNLIVKYLFVRRIVKRGGGIDRIEFKFISNTELRRRFCGDKHCGRPKSNPIFENRQSLENLLKLLVEDGILEVEGRIDRSARSKDNKKKSTPYYRINADKFFSRYPPIQANKEELYGLADPRLQKQELIKRFRTVIDGYTAFSSSVKEQFAERSKSTVYIDVALKIMRDYGITEPDDEIIYRLKELQTAYIMRNYPFDFYFDDTGNIIEIFPELNNSENI